MIRRKPPVFPLPDQKRSAAEDCWAAAVYGPASLAIEPGDPEFQQLLKDTVTAMQDDGTLSALSVQWFGVDLIKKL